MFSPRLQSLGESNEKLAMVGSPLRVPILHIPKVWVDSIGVIS